MARCRICDNTVDHKELSFDDCCRPCVEASDELYQNHDDEVVAIFPDGDEDVLGC